MPRRRAAPRLYLDPGRRQWVIRDGPSFIRTGCVESDRRGAETRLAAYLGQKHKPGSGPDPLIDDVLLIYAQEHVPHIRTAKNTSYNISSLSKFWGGRSVSDINSKTCRQYAEGRTRGGARHDLEVLRAALHFYQRERGLAAVPRLVLPDKGQPRERWLTRKEAAALLRAAEPQHLRRFILLGLYTGTRSGAILRLTWDQIDLVSGVLSRRAIGETEDRRKRAPKVRLGKRILAHLRRWQRIDAKTGVQLICHYNGKHVMRPRKSFAQAVKKAGLTEVIPHTLRHTRATWLMQAGVDIWEAAGHLGMTPDVLTRIYGHHSPEWQRRASET